MTSMVFANLDKGITTVQHQPISSDSKKLDDILKKLDRMGKRLDTLERSECLYHLSQQLTELWTLTSFHIQLQIDLAVVFL
jgi:hypothetical protein